MTLINLVGLVVSNIEKNGKRIGKLGLELNDFPAVVYYLNTDQGYKIKDRNYCTLTIRSFGVSSQK